MRCTIKKAYDFLNGCLVFVFVFVTACSSMQEKVVLTEAEKIIIADSIRQTLHRYYDDIREKGLTAEFDYLDSTTEFFWVPPGYNLAISFDSVATILKKNAPLYSSIDNSWDTLRIIPLNNTTAIYTGKLSSTMTDTSGNTAVYKLVETGFMIRRKDGWKLLSGQTSIVDK